MTRTAPAPALAAVPVAPPARWRDLICAQLGGLCLLLRAAHRSRVPF